VKTLFISAIGAPRARGIDSDARGRLEARFACSPNEKEDPVPDDPEKPDFSDVVSGSSSTAPSPNSAESSAPTDRMYVVQSGDSLSKIAKKFYGNANSWKRIFDANKDVVKNPDLIQPGWMLRIPD
jgi:nucleoid-associated protein YgaU